MARTLTEADEGKHVVTDADDTIGMISEVRDDAAFVDPDPGITDQVMSRLGWAGADEDHYELDPDHIGTVTDDKVHLK